MDAENLKETVLEKFKKVISDFDLLSKNDRVLVSVSGGPDSTALLLLLQLISSQYGLELAVFHLNHGLRESASRDEEFVKKLAEKFGLEFYGFKEDVLAIARAKKISVEEAGRKVRYELLEKVAEEKGFQKIAVGHTLSDVAETVVMRLITHSNFDALKGIEPKVGKIIRPLIYLKKEEIISYLNEIGQHFCTDETNFGTENLRALVRNKILPIIKEANPSFEEKTFELSASVREVSDLIERLSQSALESSLKKENGALSLNIEKITGFHRAILKKAVYFFLLQLGVSKKAISTKMINSVLDLLNGKITSLDLPGKVRLKRKDGFLVPEAKKSVQKNFAPMTLELPGKLTISEIPATLIVELLEERPQTLGDGKITCVLDASKVGRKIVVRPYKPGDKIKPLGMQKEKKLQDIFVNEKVPWEKRKLFPVVEAENGKICWVAGLKLSEDFKVDENTKKFYLFNFLPLEDEGGEIKST